MATCEHGSEIGQCTCTADHCSVCGGEKDAEGWCANYCTGDDHIPLVASENTQDAEDD